MNGISILGKLASKYHGPSISSAYECFPILFFSSCEQSGFGRRYHLGSREQALTRHRLCYPLMQDFPPPEPWAMDFCCLCITESMAFCFSRGDTVKQSLPWFTLNGGPGSASHQLCWPPAPSWSASHASQAHCLLPRRCPQPMFCLLPSPWSSNVFIKMAHQMGKHWWSFSGASLLSCQQAEEKPFFLGPCNELAHGDLWDPFDLCCFMSTG